MARRWANYDSFIECKTFGHSWFVQDANAFARSSPGWRYEMLLECERCRTTRVDRLDVEGNVTSRSYKYADHYRDAKGEQKPTRPEMRILIIKRRG